MSTGCGLLVFVSRSSQGFSTSKSAIVWCHSLNKFTSLSEFLPSWQINLLSQSQLSLGERRGSPVRHTAAYTAAEADKPLILALTQFSADCGSLDWEEAGAPRQHPHRQGEDTDRHLADPGTPKPGSSCWGDRKKQLQLHFPNNTFGKILFARDIFPQWMSHVVLIVYLNIHVWWDPGDKGKDCRT